MLGSIRQICVAFLLQMVFALTLNPSPASSRTWKIQPDGSGDAPTIQAGIDSAAVGDTVSVLSGTYFEAIDFVGKDIVVRGAMGGEN